MRARQGRILLTSEYLGPIKSCFVGAGIGLVCSLACYGVVAATSPQYSYFRLGNSGLIAVIGVLFSLVGMIVGWSTSRFRFGSARGAALAGSLWPAIVLTLPLVWMFVGTLFWGLPQRSEFKAYQLVSVVLITWFYSSPLVIFFLPAAVLAGTLIPPAIVRISWWNADRLK
jgi:hypothetical protein